MMFTRTVLAASVAAGLTLGWALPAAAASKKELVAKLVALHQPGVESMAHQLVEAPLPRMAQQAGAVIEKQVPADKREAVTKEIQAEIKRYVDETVPIVREKATQAAPAALGPLFEAKFNEEELQQVIAWMESPVSKKYAGISFDMQKALGEKVVSQTREPVEKRLQALQQSIAKKLGLKPPAEGASGPAAKKK